MYADYRATRKTELTIFLRITKRSLKRGNHVHVSLQVCLAVGQLLVQRLDHRFLLLQLFRLLRELRNDLRIGVARPCERRWQTSRE